MATIPPASSSGASQPMFPTIVTSPLPPGVKLRCPCCPFNNQFAKVEPLQRHLSTNHDFNCRPFICNSCRTSRFPTETSLRSHYEEDHAMNKFKVRYEPTEDELYQLGKIENLIQLAVEQAIAAASNHDEPMEPQVVQSTVNVDLDAPPPSTLLHAVKQEVMDDVMNGGGDYESIATTLNNGGALFTTADGMMNGGRVMGGQPSPPSSQDGSPGSSPTGRRENETRHVLGQVEHERMGGASRVEKGMNRESEPSAKRRKERLHSSSSSNHQERPRLLAGAPPQQQQQMTSMPPPLLPPPSRVVPQYPVRTHLRRMHQYELEQSLGQRNGGISPRGGGGGAGTSPRGGGGGGFSHAQHEAVRRVASVEKANLFMEKRAKAMAAAVSSSSSASVAGNCSRAGSVAPSVKSTCSNRSSKPRRPQPTLAEREMMIERLVRGSSVVSSTASSSGTARQPAVSSTVSGRGGMTNGMDTSAKYGTAVKSVVYGGGRKGVSMKRIMCNQCRKMVPYQLNYLANHVNKHQRVVVRRCMACRPNPRGFLTYTRNSIAVHMGAEHADLKEKSLYIEVNDDALARLRRAVRSYFPNFTEAHMRREQNVRVEAERDPFGLEEEDDDVEEEDEDEPEY